MANILIVEDDAALQEAYSFILQRGGHKVQSAYNGAEGLSLTKDNTFDIILLDIHMPVMGGVEFLQNYRPVKHTGTKVIIFSNMVEPDIENIAMKLGAYRCILKSSMTPSMMLELIDTTLADKK